MRILGFRAYLHSIGKSLIFLVFAILLLLSCRLIDTAHCSTTLEFLPQPFVSPDGLLNCSIVVASSVGHGPCGGAHTMDVMGAIMIGGKFGLRANQGIMGTTMDDSVSTYDYGTARVYVRDNSSNLVVVGGPGVNQVTWYYNNLRNSTGGRALPVYFDKDENGVDVIHVASSGHSYTIEYDGTGRVKTDYGTITLFHDDEHGRSVLILAGLGGSGTWASCKVMSTFESWSLEGNAAIVKYYDSDGDGLLDDVSVLEQVSGEFHLSSAMGALFLGLFLPVLLSKVKVMKNKVARSKTFLIALLALLLLAVAAQITSFIQVSSVPSSEVYTFRDLSQPFVSPDGLLNCSIVVASSVGHGPCGGAHTMDVMGAIAIMGQFGVDAADGEPMSALDDHLSYYNFSAGRLDFAPLSSNLVVVGGPGVNQVTWYYNNLRNSTGGRVLPVYFDKDQDGVDIIHVAPSGHSYTIEYDGTGRVKTDYGTITLFHDDEHGVWVLLISGLGGLATNAASSLLTRYKNWGLFGGASIVRYVDSDGDGYLDDMTIVESVGIGKSIEVYWDPQCSSVVGSIEWGTLYAGESNNVTVYVRNEGESATVLSLGVSDWSPIEATNYLSIDWNYSGFIVESGDVAAINLFLTVDPTVIGISDFAVNISIDSD